MGKRQNALEKLLRQEGAVTHNTLPFRTFSDIEGSPLKSEIERVYRLLGGILPAIPPPRLRRWDMEFEGIAVELDEELHFNSYRAITLDSPAYKELPAFPLDLYKQYCSYRVGDCLKAGGFGGKWSSESCEYQFGRGSPARDLSGNGSPRWKQRAFYDFVKDLSPLLLHDARNFRVVRIAVWDVMQEDGGSRAVKTCSQRRQAGRVRLWPHW